MERGCCRNAGSKEGALTLPAAEEQVFGLPVGGVSRPIQAPAGYWIFRVEARRVAPPPPREQLRATVRDELTRARERSALEDYVRALRASERVNISL